VWSFSLTNENQPGPRRVSIVTVARRAGVSTATVSRIMNGVRNKASAETVTRVQQAVSELGYRPSSAGQTLRRSESRLVALIASNLANPVMSAIAASVEVALRERGLVMVLCDSHDRPDLQDEYLLEMRAQAVRGFILLGAVESPALKDMLKTDADIVFVNRANPYGVGSAFVGIDNAKAAEDVADFLYAKGVREPLVIHGSLASSATSIRVQAFQRRFCELSGNVTVNLRSDTMDHMQLGRQEIAAYIEHYGTPPSGVFCLSDLIAYGAARALRDAGHAPSCRCLIVGFDDNPMNDWVAPWLTSVRVPYRQFGPAIVQTLLDQTSDQSSHGLELPHTLVDRSDWCG
jgi:LacI family transcriptional regulator